MFSMEGMALDNVVITPFSLTFMEKAPGECKAAAEEEKVAAEGELIDTTKELDAIAKGKKVLEETCFIIDASETALNTPSDC